MKKIAEERREQIREARKKLLWLLGEYDRLGGSQPNQEPATVKRARQYFRQLSERRQLFTVIK